MKNRKEVLIRSCEPFDAQRINEIFSQRSVFTMALDLPLTPMKRWQHFSESENGSDIFCFVACIDDVVVGCARLVVYKKTCQRHVGSFGIFVDENYRLNAVGNRLMETIINFAEDWLAILRLEVTVSTNNKICLNMCKRYNFEIEGVSKMFAFSDGNYIDAYRLARIKKPIFGQV